MTSYGTEISYVLHSIWKEDPSRTPEQIDDLVIKRIKGFYTNIL